MDEMTYRSTLIRIAATIHELQGLIPEPEELAEWLRENQRMDTIMPFVDPTGWMRYGNELRNRQEVASALITFLAVAKKHPIAITAEQVAARERE